VAGQPYTISEFNEPWPNRHAAEIDPEVASFAAFQDWDAITHFAYSHGRSWENRGVGNFDINADWSKYTNIGQSAWLFRSGAIQTGKEVLELGVTREMQLEAARLYISDIRADQRAIALVRRVATAKSGKRRDAPQLAGPSQSDTGELLFSEAKYTIAAPQAAGAFGFLGRDKITASAIDVQLATEDFATILVTSLDSKPLPDSARLLISTPGYTLGTVRASDPPRLQKFVKYPGTDDWWTLEPPSADSGPSDERAGQPPVWMRRIESSVTLRTNAQSLAVYPLDGAGARLEPLPPSAVKPCPGGFQIHLQADGQQFAPWYEVEARK